MDMKKFLTGTLAGGAAYFLLGWLLYGMLLMDTMAEYSNPCSMRAETDMVWGAMIGGNLGLGALLTYIFLKMGNVTTFGSGASTGAVLTLLVAVSYDLMIYATTTMMTSSTGIVIDVVVSTVMGAVAGGIVGQVLGMGAKPATP
jgi:hypothetical protein